MNGFLNLAHKLKWEPWSSNNNIQHAKRPLKTKAGTGNRTQQQQEGNRSLKLYYYVKVIGAWKQVGNVHYVHEMSLST